MSPTPHPGEESLDRSIYELRTQRATVKERRYLRAMAELGPGPYKVGAVATTMGSTTTALSTVRQRLLDRGLIYATEGYGHVDFTVPRFDEFMRRHMPGRCRYELHPPTKTCICWAFIGAPGFEPGTSPTRTVRATRLRHAPNESSIPQPSPPGRRDRAAGAPAAFYGSRPWTVWPTACLVWSTVCVTGWVTVDSGGAEDAADEADASDDPPPDATPCTLLATP